MAGHDLIGSTMGSPEPRSCGLCGDFRKLTKAHVPPQVAGNTSRVERASDLVDENRVRRPGRWSPGGMWVRGLCEPCNNLAGIAYDRAYADFADQIARLTTHAALRLTVIPGEAPGARFAPGLVARCVLFGMFAINPRLRVLFPDLAHDLLTEVPGEGPVRWPDRLALKVGRTQPRFERHALLVSGVWSMRVLVERVRHSSFADIVFPPLVWCLVPVDDSHELQLGPEVTKPLVDASDWVHYGPDRTSVDVDLRHLTRTFPALAHPMHVKQDDWVEMLADSTHEGGPVVLFGRIP